MFLHLKVISLLKSCSYLFSHFHTCLETHTFLTRIFMCSFCHAFCRLLLPHLVFQETLRVRKTNNYTMHTKISNKWMIGMIVLSIIRRIGDMCFYYIVLILHESNVVYLNNKRILSTFNLFSNIKPFIKNMFIWYRKKNKYFKW